MTINGKIFDIIMNHEKKMVELVMRKRKGDAYYPICFIGFSNIYDIVKKIGIEKTDKVHIIFTLRSKKYQNKNGSSRYYTSAVIDDVEIIEKNKNRQIEVVFVDTNTGEIIEDANNINHNTNH